MYFKCRAALSVHLGDDSAANLINHTQIQPSGFILGYWIKARSPLKLQVKLGLKPYNKFLASGFLGFLHNVLAMEWGFSG